MTRRSFAKALWAAVGAVLAAVNPRSVAAQRHVTTPPPKQFTLSDIDKSGLTFEEKVDLLTDRVLPDPHCYCGQKQDIRELNAQNPGWQVKGRNCDCERAEVFQRIAADARTAGINLTYIRYMDKRESFEKFGVFGRTEISRRKAVD